MKKLLFITSAVLLICVVLCSCGNSKLVGDWELVSGSTDVESMTLYSDGTCLCENENGTWEIVDGQLKILGPFGGQFFSHANLTGSYKLSGDTLTVTNATIDGKRTNENVVYRKVS